MNKLQSTLEAPICEYLPASLTRAIHIYKGTDYSDRIKVSELINQSSGLADYETDKPRGGKSVLDELKSGHDCSITTVEALEIVRHLSPHFPPGTRDKAHYSNLNYRLLGAIIEAVTGHSMAVNFEERISIIAGLGCCLSIYLNGATGNWPQPVILYRGTA